MAVLLCLCPALEHLKKAGHVLSNFTEIFLTQGFSCAGLEDPASRCIKFFGAISVHVRTTKKRPLRGGLAGTSQGR